MRGVGGGGGGADDAARGGEVVGFVRGAGAEVAHFWSPWLAECGGGVVGKERLGSMGWGEMVGEGKGVGGGAGLAVSYMVVREC